MDKIFYGYRSTKFRCRFSETSEKRLEVTEKKIKKQNEDKR
jgi:hypothetical protein